MARLPDTRRLAWVVALTLLPGSGVAQPSANRPEAAVPGLPAPVRQPPTRPAALQLWPTQTFRGVEWVSLRDIAQRFGFKAEWTKSDATMTLGDATGVRLEFENRRRDFRFDGLRVFLGDAVLAARDTLWVSKLDVIKIVAPLVRPADHLALLPATTPKIIVLDAGHGGSDPGKENHLLGLKEKTLSLDVVLRLRKILETLGWQVLLTRADDRELSPVKSVDLRRRSEIANTAHADLFLSVHFNSVEKDTERVTGVETFAMTPQFMLSTADEKKDEMTDIAFPGNKHDNANLLFGEQLHRAMISGLRASDRGLKHQRWAVVRFLDCPGALVECAYLSNLTDARRVTSPEYRQKIAEALATGIQNYATVLAALHPAPPPVAAPVTRPAPPASK
jgi:N-acetylmuramoyl-L-alanine amidase